MPTLTTTSSLVSRIAIIGFGFSGAMVAANLVRAATAPRTLYIIDAKHDARGVAYGTTNPDHLLNVRAHSMGAFADDVGGFAAWLTTDAAKHQQVSMGIAGALDGDSFVPRMLYGAYLDAVWRETQEIAAQKQLEIKLVPSHAVAVQPSADGAAAVLTLRGDAIAVDRVILAVGHETKLIFPSISSPHLIQNPWAADALAGAAHWPSPVMLVGAGLSAVDMLLSLRRAGYMGEVVMLSRHGRLPEMHALPGAIFSFSVEEIAGAKTLRQMVAMLRQNIQTVGDWRVVMDALRPHTQFLWQRLSPRDQQRFLARLLPLWNTHRHRMAPEIALRIRDEIASGTLRVLASKQLHVHNEADQLVVACAQEEWRPSRILNCTGLELTLARSINPLLRQLVAEGMLEQHMTGMGVAVDPALRAWGRAHPNLSVVGSLLTGQLLESTAVPELRVQAARVATL